MFHPYLGLGELARVCSFLLLADCEHENISQCKAMQQRYNCLKRFLRHTVQHSCNVWISVDFLLDKGQKHPWVQQQLDPPSAGSGKTVFSAAAVKVWSFLIVGCSCDQYEMGFYILTIIHGGQPVCEKNRCVFDLKWDTDGLEKTELTTLKHRTFWTHVVQKIQRPFQFPSFHLPLLFFLGYSFQMVSVLKFHSHH